MVKNELRCACSVHLDLYGECRCNFTVTFFTVLCRSSNFVAFPLYTSSPPTVETFTGVYWGGVTQLRMALSLPLADGLVTKMIVVKNIFTLAI
jgi:hypothetical protein